MADNSLVLLDLPVHWNMAEIVGQNNTKCTESYCIFNTYFTQEMLNVPERFMEYKQESLDLVT